MLRREIIIGFVVAGFASVAVPARFWNAVFLHGYGPLTMIENAIVGPFIAIISFACSVGNVPLAAALWKDGISFGGVVAFIFADLISLPLLFIYRKLYGSQLTLRLLGVFWLVMSVAGLLTELIFKAAGIIPQARPASIAPEHLSWNYTTILNIAFLFVLAALYWLHRSKERFGGGRTSPATRSAACRSTSITPVRFYGKAATRSTSALTTAGITTPGPIPPPQPTSAQNAPATWRRHAPRADPTPTRSCTKRPRRSRASSAPERRRPPAAARARPGHIPGRDLGAAGPLRDRDRRRGTARFPSAVTTACGTHGA